MILVERFFFSLPLKRNGMHKTQFNHIRFNLAPLVSDHVCFIYQVKLTQSTTLEQKRFDLRSLSPALPTLITSNYDIFLLVIIIIFFKNVSLPFTLPSSKNRYLFLLQTGERNNGELPEDGKGKPTMMCKHRTPNSLSPSWRLSLRRGACSFFTFKPSSPK